MIDLPDGTCLFYNISQWTVHLPAVRKAMGSIPVGDSDFFFSSHTRVMLISSLFTFYYRA